MTTPSFNLVDRPFIPCLLGDGSSVEWDLLTTLGRADDIVEIRDGSPVVTLALHRFLLAILHRSFGPTNRQAWADLWRAGRFDAAALKTYLDRWRDRFDLFHPQHPFYQHATYRGENSKGPNLLAREMARGNNPTLFDHTTDDGGLSLPSAAVARFLIAEQAYAVGGGRSDFGYTTHGPLVGGLCFLPMGANLFQTLMLSFIRYPDEAVLGGGQMDLPAWEQDVPPPDAPTAPLGYLDYLTCQSRSIRLDPDESGEHVVGVSYAQGRAIKLPEAFREPMFAYRRHEERGLLPIQLSEDRVLWRDSHALFQFKEGGDFLGPGTLHAIAQHREAGVLSSNHLFRLAALGLCTDKAKVNLWRHETMPLPLAFLCDATATEALTTGLQRAEEASKKIYSAARSAVERYLDAVNDKPKTDKKRVAAMVDSLAPQSLYWSALNVPFRKFYLALADRPFDRQQLLADWACNTVYRAALHAFDRSVGSLDGSARALRAAAEGRSSLLYQLNTLVQPHKEFLNATPA